MMMMSIKYEKRDHSSNSISKIFILVTKNNIRQMVLIENIYSYSR